MSTTEIQEAISALIADNQFLRVQNEHLKENIIVVDKFYNSEFTTEMVAMLHGISVPTIRKYIKLGLIPLHPNSNDKILKIRGSDALKINFQELKFKSKYD
ncbi:MAG: hypothetical protein RR183_08130 [Bacteroidales bacterium]